MRRRLGSLLVLPLLLAVLAGCGEEDGTPTADDPTSEPTNEQTSQPTSAAAVVEVLQMTAAGGVPSEELTPVERAADLDAFLAGLSGDDFVEQVRAAVEAAPGETYAAVAAVGCDVPPVDVEPAGDGYRVVLGTVADPRPECYAPVTTVAVVDVG